MHRNQIRSAGTWSVVTAVLLSMVASPAMAGGLVVWPGVRADSMGGAYTAIAEDSTAIYWNPAGLAQLEGTGAEVSSFLSVGKCTSNSSLGNAAPGALDSTNGDFPLPNIYGAGVEPDTYNKKEFTTTTLLPFIGGYKKWNGYTFAMGLYPTAGGGAKWDDTVSAAGGLDTITASIDGEQAFLLYNISAARQILPELSAGVGIDFIYSTDRMNSKKDYVSGGGAPLSYNFEVDKKASGYGVQFNGGLIYKPMKNLRGGLVVRSGSTINYSGKAKYRQSDLTALDPSLVPLDYQTDYDQKYAYPLTYGVGVAYDPIQKLTIAAQVDQYNYSSIKDDVTYKNPLTGVFVNSSNQDAGWKDITQYRFGAEYRLNMQWALRAGIQNEPAAVNRSHLTLINPFQYDNLYYAIGAGYRINKFQIDGEYTRLSSDKPSLGGREFEYPADAIRLGVSYLF